jgi:hypothetical protein
MRLLPRAEGYRDFTKTSQFVLIYKEAIERSGILPSLLIALPDFHRYILIA